MLAFGLRHLFAGFSVIIRSELTSMSGIKCNLLDLLEFDLNVFNASLFSPQSV